MTSRKIIEWILWILVVLAIFNVIQYQVIWVAWFSFLIMLVLGFFTREEEKKKDPDTRTQRQIDFDKKFKETTRTQQHVHVEDAPVGTYDGVYIRSIDADGSPSTIFISIDGKVKTSGNPNPELLRAAKLLNVSIIQNGAESVMEELKRQVEERNHKL